MSALPPITDVGGTSKSAFGCRFMSTRPSQLRTARACSSWDEEAIRQSASDLVATCQAAVKLKGNDIRQPYSVTLTGLARSTSAPNGYRGIGKTHYVCPVAGAASCRFNFVVRSVLAEEYFQFRLQNRCRHLPLSIRCSLGKSWPMHLSLILHPGRLDESVDSSQQRGDLPPLRKGVGGVISMPEVRFCYPLVRL